MDSIEKLKIITEGQNHGISTICRKYGISRTLYYRWLKRYQSEGIDGLVNKKPNQAPPNKTSLETEKTIVRLCLAYPSYGPRAIMYLMDEAGYKISESAVYNVMKRNNLSNKYNRLKHKAGRKKMITKTAMPFDEFKSGQCLIFWLTHYGAFDKIGPIIEYTIYEYRSGIACTRLFNDISFKYFEDLLTDVAMPVSNSLNFDTSHLCLFNDSKILQPSKTDFTDTLQQTIDDYNYNIVVQFITNNKDYKTASNLKRIYTERCLSKLIPILNSSSNFEDVKTQFQRVIINYNIYEKKDYDGQLLTPIERHNQLTNTEFILPLWAYIDRPY